VLVAREQCDQSGSLVVLNGDSPLISPATIASLVKMREEENAAVVVLTMELADPFGYGRIIRDEYGAVARIVEQKDATPEEAAVNECNSGFYCFDAALLFDALEKVGTNNAQGEYYLTDMVDIYVSMGEPVSAVCAEDFSEMLGINSRIQLATATKVMQLRINERLMAEGVTMLDPNQVWVGPDVTVGRDSELLPLTMLWGKTSIGEDCIVGPNATLIDVDVASGARVENVKLECMQVASDATVDRK
jgi:bifunctional UDP-N-acetylglucosamine pyrophosphorylase/glucosamine-1-phosphate N-acetyltransferase